jgi:hypothetical protein
MEQKLLATQLVKKKVPRFLNMKFYLPFHVLQLQIHILGQLFPFLILYI